MTKLKNIKWNHFLNYVVIGIFLIIYTVMTFNAGLTSSTVYLLEKIAISIILAVSLSLVVGFLGELSLGHAGFMCIGAYLGGKASVYFTDIFSNGPVALIISLIIGGAVASVFGLIIGLPALRLKGDYLAIVTLAFGEIVKSIFINTSQDTFGGALGLATPRYNKDQLFIFAFLLVLLTLMIIQNLIRSKHGRAITAIRDNEIAARATGVNVTKYKLLAFTVSAFFAGIAGVLYSYSNYKVQSLNFDYNYSIEILVMVVLGGMGSINGCIIASVLITYLNTKLATVLTGQMAVLQNLFYALILIFLIIYNNAPGFQNFRDKYNIRRLFAKRNTDPAVINDDAANWDKIPTKIKMDELLSYDITKNDAFEPDKRPKEDK